MRFLLCTCPLPASVANNPPENQGSPRVGIETMTRHAKPKRGWQGVRAWMAPLTKRNRAPSMTRRCANAHTACPSSRPLSLSRNPPPTPSVEGCSSFSAPAVDLSPSNTSASCTSPEIATNSAALPAGAGKGPCTTGGPRDPARRRPAAGGTAAARIARKRGRQTGSFRVRRVWARDAAIDTADDAGSAPAGI